MAHFPVNHPARPLYRLFSGLVGLYILVFGIFGVVETWGETLFARDGHFVLGLRTNLAFALVSVVFGAFLLLGASRRRGNLGHYMNLTAGVVFLVTALAMMTVLQTDANILNFSMSTVIVSMIFGLLLLATGLYDKVGPP
jgi:glucose uptake protein GlcU